MISATVSLTLDVVTQQAFDLLGLSGQKIEDPDLCDSIHSLNFTTLSGVDRAVRQKDDGDAFRRGWRELVAGQGDAMFVLRYHPSTGHARVHTNTLGLTEIEIEVARENINRRPRVAETDPT